MAPEASELPARLRFVVASWFAEEFEWFDTAFDEAQLETLGPIAHRVRGHAGSSVS